MEPKRLDLGSVYRAEAAGYSEHSAHWGSPRMATRKLNLIAPNSAPIVGIKLIDGTVSEFECTFYDNRARSCTCCRAEILRRC